MGQDEPSHNLTPAPEITPGFPHARSLCEQCGYPLNGLSPTAICPECGVSVAASDPVHRTGLAWQHRPTPRHFIAAIRALILEPQLVFRALRLDGSNAPDRIFLLVILALVTLIWTLVWHWHGFPDAWEWGLIAAGVVFGLTHIEILGVAFFSWRRGWRVPWRLAERVACYAAIGWIPAVIIWSELALVFWRSWDNPWWWPRWFGQPHPEGQQIVVLIMAAITMLMFETLVWLAVRQVRFGNRVEP